MRRCNICKEWKPETDFYRHKRGSRVGLTCSCKKCLNGTSRASYKKNRDRELAYGKARRKERIRQWKTYLIHRYGDEPECAICSKKLKWSSKDGEGVHFDHKTYDGLILGSPRGWLEKKLCTEQNAKIFESHNFGILCRLCNSFLGKEDRRQRLLGLSQYLGAEVICKQLSVFT